MSHTASFLQEKLVKRFVLYTSIAQAGALNTVPYELGTACVGRRAMRGARGWHAGGQAMCLPCRKSFKVGNQDVCGGESKSSSLRTATVPLR